MAWPQVAWLGKSWTKWIMQGVLSCIPKQRSTLYILKHVKLGHEELSHSGIQSSYITVLQSRTVHLSFIRSLSENMACCFFFPGLLSMVACARFLWISTLYFQFYITRRLPVRPIFPLSRLSLFALKSLQSTIWKNIWKCNNNQIKKIKGYLEIWVVDYRNRSILEAPEELAWKPKEKSEGWKRNWDSGHLGMFCFVLDSHLRRREPVEENGRE